MRTDGPQSELARHRLSGTGLQGRVPAQSGLHVRIPLTRTLRCEDYFIGAPPSCSHDIVLSTDVAGLARWSGSRRGLQCGMPGAVSPCWRKAALPASPGGAAEPGPGTLVLALCGKSGRLGGERHGLARACPVHPARIYRCGPSSFPVTSPHVISAPFIPGSTSARSPRSRSPARKPRALETNKKNRPAVCMAGCTTGSARTRCPDTVRASSPPSSSVVRSSHRPLGALLPFQ